MHSHIGCTCLTVLHCAFSNVSSNCLHEKKHSHIGCCICVTWWHCYSFSPGFSHLHPQNQSKMFVPLSMCVVLCLNGCFKLSQIWDGMGWDVATAQKFAQRPTAFLPRPSANLVSRVIPRSKMVALNWVKYMIDFWSIITSVIFNLNFILFRYFLKILLVLCTNMCISLFHSVPLLFRNSLSVLCKNMCNSLFHSVPLLFRNSL